MAKKSCTPQKSILKIVRDDLGKLFESIDGKEESYGYVDNGDGSLTIHERDDTGDLNPIKRVLYTPQAAFKQWPQLARLQRFGVETEKKISKYGSRLDSDWHEIRSKLNDEQFGELTDILFIGDSEQTEFDRKTLKEMGASPVVMDAYMETRGLLEKIGRFVDFHNRDMLPQARERMNSILRRMARLTVMDNAEFRKLYARRGRLRRRLRSGEGSPQEISEQLSEIESSLNIIREDTVEFEELQKDLDAAAAILASTSVRTKKGYIPHKFFGTWAVYEQIEIKDEAGEPKIVDKLVAGEHGFFPDRQSAVAGAKKFLAGNKDSNIIVRPVQFKFPASDATGLSDASYWRFVANVSRELELKGEELQNAIKGVARPTFKRRKAGFANFRQGTQGFSRDMDRVMQSHINEAVRYVMLDKLKYEAISTMENMGLSQHRRANLQHKHLQGAVQAWFRDVNGQKQPWGEEQIDAVLNRPWATPWKMGLTTGGVAGGMTWLAVANNPLVGMLLGSYVGYRVYSSLKNSGQFKTRAITGAMLGDMAHLKLGSFFNVYSAAVNLTQTMVNTYPILGAKYTATGIKDLTAAALSRAKKEPNHHWKLLIRAGVVAQTKYSEVDLAKFSNESAAAKASLFLFDTAENFNKAVAFLGQYQRAIDSGKQPGVAFRSAERMMERTQHHYGAAAKPEVLRNILLRVPLQFKNFMAQQLTFFFNLDPNTRDKKGLPPHEKYPETIRFLLSLFLMAGMLGLPGADIFDNLIRMLTGNEFSPINEAKKLALESQADGELQGTVGNVLLRGLPTLINEDLSSRVGMGEKFLPLNARDYKGPWISTVENAIRMGEMNATIGDHLRNLSTGIGRPVKSLEAMANGLPASDMVAEPVKFFEALFDDRIDYTNPWKSGDVEFIDEPRASQLDPPQPGLTKADLAKMAIGGSPLKVSQMRDVRDIKKLSQEVVAKKTKEGLNQIAVAFRKHGFTSHFDSVAENVILRLDKDGIAISNKQIRNKLRKIEIPRSLRDIKSTRRQLRPEIAELYDAILEGSR